MSMFLNWIFYKLVRFDSSTIIIKGRKVRALIADSFGKQLVGLMYREGIKDNEAMLFIFGRDSRWSIWMLDMKFSIDIVWLDQRCRVVDIKRDAQPCEGMLNCPTHRPSKPARYVIELKSGGAARYGIRIGDVIECGVSRPQRN